MRPGITCDLLQRKNYLPIGVLEVPTPITEPFLRDVYYRAGWCPEILDRCYYFGRLIARHLSAQDLRFIDLRLGHFRFKFISNWMHRYIIEGGSSSGFIAYKAELCTHCGSCTGLAHARD